jgi:hypothetical protein
MTGALPSIGRHQGVPCLITPIDYGWVVRGSPANHDGHLLEISQARTAG